MSSYAERMLPDPTTYSLGIVGISNSRTNNSRSWPLSPLCKRPLMELASWTARFAKLNNRSLYTRFILGSVTRFFAAFLQQQRWNQKNQSAHVPFRKAI